MIRKILLTWIWASFVVYTIRLAPLDQPETWAIAKRLLTLQWGALNAYLVTIFCLMGVWPMIFACLMFFDGRIQKIPAWPYFLSSNGTGVLCLLPYLILRQPNQEFRGAKDWWLQQLDKRSLGIGLLVTTIGLFAYAFLIGDWVDFIHQWQTVHFVHLITIDFCLMCLIFPISTLLRDDMARRGFVSSTWFWIASAIPLLGPLAYLCVRSPLPEPSVASTQLATGNAYASSHR